MEIICEFNLEIKKTTKKYDEKMVSDMIEDYVVHDMSFKELIKKYHKSIAVCRRILTMNNVEIKKKGKRAKKI